MTAYRGGRRLATTLIVVGGFIVLVAAVGLAWMVFTLVSSPTLQSMFAARLLLPCVGGALLGLWLMLCGCVARAVFDIADRGRT